MKFACLLILTLACAIVALPAQTNTATNGVESILALVTTNHPPAAPATNSPDAKPRYVHIESVGPAILDFENHWGTYSDNVLVTNDQMRLTCEWIKAEFTADWEHATNIVAVTNVVIDFTDQKGQKGRAIGTNALYVFEVRNGITNETVTLTGDPPEILEGPNFTNGTTTSRIIYDLITRRVRLESPSGTYYGTTNGAAASHSQGSGVLPFPK